MSAGREFQADGPATENARSPSLMKLIRILYVTASAEEGSPCRRDEAAVV